jgi:hypothetical protein
VLTPKQVPEDSEVLRELKERSFGDRMNLEWNPGSSLTACVVLGVFTNLSGS